jgi:hypothetical protein
VIFVRDHAARTISTIESIPMKKMAPALVSSAHVDEVSGRVLLTAPFLTSFVLRAGS